MSATWDWLNVVEEKLLATLQGDSELGTGGSLEIKTWENEAREDAGQYQGRELPAMSCDVSLLGDGSSEPLGANIRIFRAQVLFVTEAGGKDRRKTVAKQIAARVGRVMDLQIYPDNQLSNLPAALEGGVGGSVFCNLETGVVEQGEVGNLMRAVGVLLVAITVQIITPEV